MKTTTLFLAVALVVLGACATSPSKPSAPHDMDPRVAAEKMVRYRLSHGDFDLLIQEATRTAILVAQPLLEKELGRELSQKEYERLQTIYFDILPEVFPVDLWVAPMAKIYSKFFTIEELEEIAAFNETSVGRKLLGLQTTLARELEPLVITEVEKKQDELEKRITAELEQRPFGAIQPSKKREQDLETIRVTDIIPLCNEIQNYPEVSVSCSFDYLEGLPTISIGFPNWEIFKSLWEDAVDVIGVPFCKATNDANRQGLILVGISGERQARFYSCEKAEWTAWFRLDKDF